MPEKKNRKKINIKRVVQNNVFMLSFIAKVVPWFIPFIIVYHIISAVNSFLLNTFLYQYILNAVQEHKEISKITLTFIIVFSFSVMNFILARIYQYSYHIIRPKVEANIRTQLHKKAAAVELNCFENSEFYDKYVKATEEASNRAFDVLLDVENLVWNIINTATNFVLTLSIDPIFLVIGILPMFLVYVIGKFRNKVNHEYDMKWRETVRQRDYVRRTFYLSDFSKEMRLTNMWKVMFKRMSDSVSQLRAIVKEYGFKRMFFAYSFDIIFDIFVHMGTIILAAYKALVSKTMLLGDCFVVIKTTEFIAWNFGDIGDSFLRLDGHSRYIETFREFYDYESKIPEIETAPKAPSLETFEIRNVSFLYENKEIPALKNVSFKINKGERIAIVGHNGAGKTTLIKLLLRFYDPTDGEILLNGENIKKFRLSTYRGLFGTVFQDYGLFAVSVAQNVLMRGAVSDDDREKVCDALKNSGMWNKISELPKGIDTTVTKEFDKDGAVFSGGETQKIAIASVFAVENEIVLMDEPTSALDPIAEQEMYENMFKACEGKTVIFISHRLSATTYADRIYMFENGEIIESGSHSELMALDGKFADMWHKQADSYTEREAVVE